MTAPLRFTVNDQLRSLTVPPDTPLLTVLRNDLELNGPKYGCGLAACGACAVLVDGIEARACVIPVGGIEGRHVTTLEGLVGPQGQLHPVQQAFIDCQAAQCGYCLNGMIVSTVALLRRHPRPTEAQARAALAHNLCRCGTHLEILQAVRRAAELASRAGASTRDARTPGHGISSPEDELAAAAPAPLPPHARPPPSPRLPSGDAATPVADHPASSAPDTAP